MRSKTSYFSAAVFRKNVTRFMPLWTVYAIVCFLMLPMLILGELRYRNSNADVVLTLQNTILNSALVGGIVVGLIAAIFAAMAVWSYLYTPRSAGLIASLPVRREGMFATNYLSGLACLLAVNVLILVISLVIVIVTGVAAVIPHLFLWLLITTMLLVFFYSFATLCAMLTGQTLTLPLLYLVLNFTEVFSETIIKQVFMRVFIYGFHSMTEFSALFLSPSVYIASEVQVMSENSSCYITGWGVLAAYFIAGIVLTAISLQLYRKRRMETASDVIAVTALRPAFKYFFTYCCSLILGFFLFGLFYSGFSSYAGMRESVAMTLFLIIGASVGYFFGEMLLRKSFRVFRSSWRGYAAVVGFIVILCAALEFDISGYEKRVPDPGDVEKVTVSCYGSSGELTEAGSLELVHSLHTGLLANKLNYEQTFRVGVSNNYVYNTGSANVTIAYLLKSGKVLVRSYMLRYNYDGQQQHDFADSDVSKVLDTINSKEAVRKMSNIYPPLDENVTVNSATVTYPTNLGAGTGGSGNIGGTEQARDESADVDTLRLTPDELDELMVCIRSDISDGTLGKTWIHEDDKQFLEMYDATITLHVTITGKDLEKYSSDLCIRPSTDSIRTVEWLTAHGVPMVMLKDTHEFRKSADKAYY